MPLYGSIQLATKSQAWHNANATLVVEAGRPIYLEGTNPLICKVGDGTTQLQNLKWSQLDIVLTGLGAGSNAQITATDTLLEALAKLQAQIDYLNDNSLINE